MTKKEEINSLIEGLIVEKTFSLEIVEKIKTMRDSFIAMEEKEKTTHEQNIILQKENSSLSELNSKLITKDFDVSTREAVVSKKESKQALEDLKLEHANQRATEIRELFGIVFKNPVVRESVYNNKSSSLNNYGQSGNENSNENGGRTIEKE